MSQPAVILVETSVVEAVLACAALALRPEVMVLQAEDLREASDLLGGAPVALAILGKEALGAADGRTLQAFVSGGVPVVGLGVNLPESVRRQALAAGVSEVHERPREWHAYRSLVSGLLDSLLPTRTG
ncbi:MAG: hypothetical protein HY467_01715 [Betaproteobacteria bacterium]|nr:hypothetical protein [Betaproteobacteria bacterium]